MTDPRTSQAFLQLKVTMLGVSPAVWRRIVVPGSVVLPDLHVVLQKAFGWTDSHLHAFEQGRKCFQPFNPDLELGRDPGCVSDEARVVLSELLYRKGDELDYQYDFGDFWEHAIVVEEVLSGASSDPVRCLAGARSALPEDCGGVSGYAGLLEALADPDHPEHDDLSEWAGEDFDPEAFDLKAVNRALAKLKRRK
jgi:hypothetical protein